MKSRQDATRAGVPRAARPSSDGNRSSAHRPREAANRPRRHLAPGRSRIVGVVGLTDDRTAAAIAVLLDILAAALPHLDAGVRPQVLESYRLLLGEQMASPQIRRARRQGR
jgi:hypothetical protein